MKTPRILIAAFFCMTFITCTSSQTADKANPFFFPKYSQTIRPASGTKWMSEAKMEISFILTDARDPALAKVVHSALYNGLTPKEYSNKVIKSSKDDYLGQVAEQDIEPEWIDMFQWEYTEKQHVDITGNYAVISRNIYQYLGGAHGYTGISCHVFNTETPQQLLLDGIITGTGFSRLMTLVRAELRRYSEQETGKRIGPNDPLSSGGLYQTDTVELQQWFPAEEGICFFWNPYEIASYADGHIFVTVSWNDLKAILTPMGAALAGAYQL